MAKITIYVPDQEPLKVSFDEQAEITIGRAPDNDLVVDHESMSGHHAKLQQKDNGYILVDLDSTNGSKIDGISTSSGPLSNGTQITFGRVDAVYACEPVASEESDEDESFGGDGESFVSNMEVDIAEASVKGAGFSNLSPLEKAVEKNQLGKVAMAAGIFAILIALVTFGAAASMKVG